MMNTTKWYPIALAIQSKLEAARHRLEDLQDRLMALFHQPKLHEHDSALPARTAYLEVVIERGVGPAEHSRGVKQVPEPVSSTYRSRCRPGTGAGSESVREEPEPLWKVCTGTAHGEFDPKPPPKSSPMPPRTRKPGHGDRALPHVLPAKYGNRRRGGIRTPGTACARRPFTQVDPHA